MPIMLPSMTMGRMAFRLARIVALLLGVTWLWACRCPPPSDEIFLLHLPDEATQPLVDQCLQARQCLPLCQKVAGPNADVIHCEIHQQPDPEFIEVHVGLESFCGA